MKPSWEWTEDDLLLMKVNQTEESLSLEFKRSQAIGRSDRNKKELSKDISAFANSAGGDIIYGVAETGKPPSRFGDIDDGIDPVAISPEWVEQVLTSNIQPKIEGLRVHPVELKTSRPGLYAYVVHAPVSNKAHQASDKRYYKRSNFASVPMEDYEIQDVRNRTETLNLFVFCRVTKARYYSFSKPVTWPNYFLGGVRSGPVRIPSFDLQVSIVNKGIKAAKNAQVVLSFDNLKIKKTSSLAARIDHLRGGRLTLQIPLMNEIIHAKTNLHILDLSLEVNKLYELCKVTTEVVAEDFERETRDYKFHTAMMFFVDATDADGNKQIVSLDWLDAIQKDVESKYNR
jgi:hypothetical protein